MRVLLVVVLVTACHPAARPGAPVVETLARDAPRATAAGSTFIAPAGWTLVVRGAATILEAPERGSWIALVDVPTADADAAVERAWAAYRPDRPWKLKLATSQPAPDGWAEARRYTYETSPAEARDVQAFAARHAQTWTIAIADLARAVGEKRDSQISLLLSRLAPKGYHRESFAGRPARVLDAARIAELTRFVERARTLFEVPAISLGIVQDGEVRFAGGFGVRELGQPAPPDADTLYLIASDTKALTTLLLAKLVDQGRLQWDTPVVQVMPSFKLGDAATTASMRVKHLVCACTGLPRQDLEWLTEFRRATPASMMALLATMQPTSKFGALFQYSNLLAAAGGYVAAYARSPERELGAGYDAAMQAEVLDPLGMTATTFDFARALRGNHAGAYGLDVDGAVVPAVMELNYAAIPLRPAGGAWSNVRDLLKVVEMELARGVLPDGRRYIGEAALLARRTPQVAIDGDESYGLGLAINTRWGVPLVSHGGDLSGYHSDVMWLPDHGVGAVILTNAQAGMIIREVLHRKLLEVVFDGEPRADAELAAAATQLRAQRLAERAQLTVPPSAADVQ
ncbi:MAG: serine hydrolase domain-containing protein, partial [Kofleriaceae bacterium]